MNLAALAVTLLPACAAACDAPVCLVAPETLRLGRQVTFDDLPAGLGPGRLVAGPLVAEGVRFGKGFAGQDRRADGPFDRITGPALAPLALLATPEAAIFSIIRLPDSNVLNGLGPLGWPRADATGEGAIAVLFDRDQAALRLDMRGGEGGTATVLFLARDGAVIASLVIGPLAEDSYGLRRRDGLRDIAAIVITNDDPEGIALDALAYDGDDVIG
jgi:hypothetical protein